MNSEAGALRSAPASGGKDFSPTPKQISLHGLGFIQVALPASRRMHVWHPDLPRRACFDYSPIHNHRFSFRSTVLVGTQINRRFNVIEADYVFEASHVRISHDGPRSEKGGRMSFAAGYANAEALPDEHYGPGQSYEMPILQYHETPNSGVVVTLMEKLVEGIIHASTLFDRSAWAAGARFDQDFDRFQLPENRLWAIVTDALRGAA